MAERIIFRPLNYKCMEEPIAMRNEAVSNATGVVSLPPPSLSHAPNDVMSHILDCATCLDIMQCAARFSGVYSFSQLATGEHS
jgi:hypothetical protein